MTEEKKGAFILEAINALPRMPEEIMDEAFRIGSFNPIDDWLNENIHKELSGLLDKIIESKPSDVIAPCCLMNELYAHAYRRAARLAAIVVCKQKEIEFIELKRDSMDIKH